MSKRLIYLAVILFIVGCSSPGSSNISPATPSSNPDQVLFSLDWVVSGRHAGYFVALDKGYYAQENISVTIIRGYNSTDSIKQVASGRSQFAFADMGTLILSRGSDNVPVKAVAMIYANAPHLLFCNAEAGINEPKGLEGHTIGAPAGNSHRVLFPAFSKLNNVDPNKVSWQTLDAALLGSTLFSKKVDCIPEYFTPLLEKQSRDANFKYTIIRFADFGMNFYSNAIVASEKMINTNPDLVSRFVRATLKGLQYSFEHPDEAIDILQKYHREVDDKVIAVQEVDLVESYAMSNEAKNNGLGYMDASRVSSTVDLITKAFVLKDKVNPEDVYTNKFLPNK